MQIGRTGMSGIIGKQEHFVSRLWMLLMLLASVGSLLSCSKQENATTEKPAAQKTFASPADAGAAFFEAAKSGDQTALLAIFGPDAKDVLFSGDPVKDKDALQGLRCRIQPDESLGPDQGWRRDALRRSG